MAQMKLMTQNLKNLIKNYPLGSQDGKGLEAKVLTKYFDPYSQATWYILEGEIQENDEDHNVGDVLFFCYGGVFLEFFEYGYVTLGELKSIGRVERERVISNCEYTLGEYLDLDGIDVPKIYKEEEETQEEANI